MPNFGGFEDEEEDVLAPKEPQVTSLDPEERKAARLLRIKRRQEAIKKAEQPPEDITAEEEPTLIEQATTTAAEDLQRLSLDGRTNVTNVKVTTDEREVERRAAYFEEMQLNLNKIEAEANEAQLEYEVITKHWDEMFKIKDPLDIEVAIQDQRQRLDTLLEQKNELIVHLKDDLRKIDDQYFEELAKQDKEIKELSERIEKQLTIMQRAYQKQLSLIEKAIMIEREGMLEHHSKRWDALYKQRDREEVAHMEYKFDQLEQHKQVVESIMWDHHEKFREAKIELETLIQELQKELEKLKATCIINTEKIGYTYQVLKKREEENIFVRSQQKRKLNKMADISNALRAKIRKSADDGAAEEQRADAEIMKLMATMDELEKKCYHFSHVNDYKFCQVWRMSAAKCGEMARELRRAEVALHAHILAEPAPPPPPPPPHSPLVIKTDDTDVTKHNKSAGTEDESKQRLVRHILDLVADNTGFLVEDRLLKLIDKYPATSRNLCTLDAIFMALEIQAEEDIELLCQTFMKYAFCPVCVGMDVASDIIDPPTECGSFEETRLNRRMSSRGDRSPSSMRPRTSVARSLSISTSRSINIGMRVQELTPSDQQLMVEADEIMQKCGDPQVGVVQMGVVADAGPAARRGGPRGPAARGVTVAAVPVQPVATEPSVNPYLCSVGHPLEIEPMQVLTALAEFIEVFVPPEKKKLCDILDGVKPPDFSSPSRRIRPADIEHYWAQWQSVFPPEKDRFWDGLLAGLSDYLHILQERDRLNEEVVALRSRNSSLRRLVRGALPPVPPAPKYLRPPPPAFTASRPEVIPPHSALPPI